MNINFIIPASFDPPEFLRVPSLLHRCDDARYIVSVILNKLARQNVDEFGVVRLMAKHLANIMDRATYKQVIDALRFGNAIQRFPYAVGVRAFGYLLGERFVADKHVRVPATDLRLIRRLERFHAQNAAERDARMKPVHRELAIRQSRLEIHGDEARQILKGLPNDCNPYDVQGLMIGNIEARDFVCNVGKYGRFTNNITSLKRELRNSLHVDGKPLKSVDISCAQPALIGQVVSNQNNHREGTTKEKNGRQQSGGKYDYELRQYVSLVQSGHFYEFMMSELKGHSISREQFKELFLQDVVAKKGRYKSFVEDKFRELFPSVYQFIRRVNANDHANLIRLLQRAESSLVIERVAADFMALRPTAFVISLHDALYTTPDHLPALEQAFHRGFEQSGFPMQLKVET